MNKINIAYIGENTERFIGMSLESIKNIAKKIIFVDGGSKDNTIKIVKNFCNEHHIKLKLIREKFKHEYTGANGFQRNIYLKYLINTHKNEWCLVLDPDEVVSDNAEDILKITEELNRRTIEIASIKMRHTIGDLGHEDVTVNEHWVLNRLFKVSDDLFYPETEHPVLSFKKDKLSVLIKDITIWHLAYSSSAFELHKRYLNHKKKSEIHSKQFLDWWYLSHISGTYPKKQIDITELPTSVKQRFEINDDYFYFLNRKQIQTNHLIDAYHWKEYFKPKTALEIGCGFGQRVLAMNMFEINAKGIELSKYAVENSLIKEKVIEGNIIDEDYIKVDLVICYDVLEHIEEKDLDKALNNIYSSGNDFVFSIPFEGDPNLLADKTHKIFKSKIWWIDKLKEKGFKIKITPSYFLFKDQLIICSK